MIYTVEISGSARADLNGIYEYIAFGLLSPASARKQIERLESLMSKLDCMPERFRLCELEPWKSLGVRIVPVDNFVILYIPRQECNIVTILRVIYSGRDIYKELIHMRIT